MKKNIKNSRVFNDTVQGKERDVLDIPKDAILLGHTHCVVFETKDGKLDFQVRWGGYSYEDMASHMNDPLVKALRNFHYENTKKSKSEFIDSQKVKAFDYEL